MRFKKQEFLTKAFEKTVLRAFGAFVRAVVKSIIAHICLFVWPRALVIVGAKGQPKDSI